MSGQWFKCSATRSVVTLIFFPPWSTAKLSKYFTAVDLTSSVFKRPAADNISPILPHLSTAALSTGCAFGRLLPLWIFETSLRKTRQLCAAHCCHYVTTVPSSNLATLSDAFLLFFFFLGMKKLPLNCGKRNEPHLGRVSFIRSQNVAGVSMRKKSTCSLCVLTAAATWTECNFPALSASWQNTTRDFPLSEEISTETNVLDYLPVDWSAPLRPLTLPMIFNGSRKRPEADQTSWRPLVKTFSVKVNHSAAGSSSTPVDGHAPFKFFFEKFD